MFKDRVTIEVTLPVGVDVRDVMQDMFERYRQGPTPPGVKFRIVTVESPDTEEPESIAPSPEESAHMLSEWAKGREP